MKNSDVSFEIEKAVATMHDTIGALAETVRRDTIEPVCKKLKLQYLAGNGMFSFFAMVNGQEVAISSAHSAATLYGGRFVELAPIFDELLNLELPGNDCLGFHVGDINYLPKPKKGKKKA